jgi:hypothetical protein
VAVTNRPGDMAAPNHTTPRHIAATAFKLVQGTMVNKQRRPVYLTERALSAVQGSVFDACDQRLEPVWLDGGAVGAGAASGAAGRAPLAPKSPKLLFCIMKIVLFFSAF